MSTDAYAGFHPAGAGWVVGRFSGPARFDKKVGAFLSVINGLVVRGLGELVSSGRVSLDSIAGPRALITSHKRREWLRRYRRPLTDVDEAGRWSLPRRVRAPETAEALGNPATDHIAWVLLRRYGVVFRKLPERETGLPPGRKMFYVYRCMEARGEIRGGRFVSEFAEERIAPEEAAELLRCTARDAAVDRVAISAADSLSLLGAFALKERIPALLSSRILFEVGVPSCLAALIEVLPP